LTPFRRIAYGAPIMPRPVGETRPRRRCVSRLLPALLLSAATAAAVPTPIVTGPIAGAPFLISTNVDLAAAGYVEEEYFLSGTASSFTSATPLGNDGKWTTAAAGTAAYTTRIVVRRPAKVKKFNGTVLVEWLNVSGGLDAAPDWVFIHTALMRDGYAYVAVSAQFVGVAGTGGPLGLNLSLKAVNPVRYGPLEHPGDSFSYDMFSQVAQAIRHPDGVAPLGPLRVKRILATGESQSAFRFVTYVNGVHPLAKVYDGFLIHSRGANGAQLSQAPQAVIDVPTPTLIRDDIDVPVLTFETETDLVSLGFFPARQPDIDRIRLWEVAGTAHGDTYQLNYGLDDHGKGALDTTHLPLISEIYGGIIKCDQALNQGPQHYVLAAALTALDRWARSGRPPRREAPRLEVVAGIPPTITRDALGNALGGIRTPQVDVPIMALSGLGQTGASFCRLFGTSALLDAPTLASLYPNHAAYVAAVAQSARQAIRERWVLQPDAKVIKASATASTIGN
jgi:Alpha/beta hydrolase domain